ncbi:MAG TPA: zf-HC2 domain-containing protein [Chthonomonadaceae bacterium]|nr:zf-HC2 domain-containing protein [Chthonomonadaceae bacterium]
MLNRHSNSRRDPQDVNNLRAAQSTEYPFAVVPPSYGDGDFGGGHEGGNEACRLVAVSLSAYLDGELDEDQQQVVETHLDRCPKCVASLAALETTDTLIEREWRDNAPLPSSSEVKNSIDSIMAALPPAPAATPEFAPKRVHAKARWIRFSTGIAGVIAFMSLLWSSYRLGYANGRTSAQPSFMPSPVYENPMPRPTSDGTNPAPTISTASLRTLPASLSTSSTTLTRFTPPEPPSRAKHFP